MCLTIPKQIISIKKDLVKLKSKNGSETAGSVVNNIKKGDWVLTQNSVIIKKINKKQAKEILKIIKNYEPKTHPRN
jgi:hydrogenase maturation factor